MQPRPRKGETAILAALSGGPKRILRFPKLFREGGGEGVWRSNRRLSMGGERVKWGILKSPREFTKDKKGPSLGKEKKERLTK